MRERNQRAIEETGGFLMHEEETTIIVASAKDGADKEVGDSRKKLVKEIQARVSNAKSHYKMSLTKCAGTWTWRITGLTSVCGMTTSMSPT